ncbi:PQQ-binding-like beta-propeller repeat protein [bacterium]|nr:PQQ-binding-like beta-propeller repeat protein [bacterium]
MKKIGLVLNVLILLISITSCSKQGSDWSQWRGPNGNAVTDESGWRPEAINDESNILWRANVGAGHSSVTVKDNRLYTMGQTKIETTSDTTFESAVWCLDTETGSTVWRYTWPTEEQQWPGPGSTPVIDENRVYALSRKGNMYCFDALSGEVNWMINIVKENLGSLPNENLGFHSSALIVGEKLILNSGSAGLSLNKMTGDVIWHSGPGKGGHASPVLLNGGATLIVNPQKKMVIVDLNSGKVLWGQDWGGSMDAINLGDSRIFAPRCEFVQLLNVSSNGADVLWESTQTLPRSFLNFTVFNEHAYGFSRKGRDQVLQCISMDQGDVIWQEECNMFGALIVADGKLIMFDGIGMLIIANASAEGYNVLAQRKLFDLKDRRDYPRNTRRDLIEYCWTNPVLVNGKLYARTNHGNLACVDLR